MDLMGLWMEGLIFSAFGGDLINKNHILQVSFGNWSFQGLQSMSMFWGGLNAKNIPDLGGGFKHFIFSPPSWGDDPIWTNKIVYSKAKKFPPSREIGSYILSFPMATCSSWRHRVENPGEKPAEFPRVNKWSTTNSTPQTL